MGGWGPKQLQGICVWLFVGVWTGWQESFQHKQCGTGAINSSSIGWLCRVLNVGGSSPFLAPSTRNPTWMNWGKGANPNDSNLFFIWSPSDYIILIILLLRLLVCQAPQMLSQVMVRRTRMIILTTENSGGHAYERCQRSNWGCSARTNNDDVLGFDHMFKVLQIVPLKHTKNYKDRPIRRRQRAMTF